jgi:mono/diheme cytochrome c family protein
MGRAVALGLVVLVFAGAAAAQPSAADRGAALAKRNCGMCHAIGPQGKSPFPAAPPFRELGKRYSLDDLQEALAEGMLTGHPAMPEFRFSPAQINDLITYLKTIQERDQARVGRTL